MRTNSVQPRWKADTQEVNYLVRVQGVQAGLLFTDDELELLIENIRKAQRGNNEQADEH